MTTDRDAAEPDPDFGPLTLVATERVAPARDGRVVVRRRWSGRVPALDCGLLIALDDAAPEDIATNVRRDYRALCEAPKTVIEDVATRGHWRIGDPEEAVRCLSIAGITVVRDRIAVWLEQDPPSRQRIEVIIADGAIVAVDYDP
ncbi:hypothetical protein ABB55_27070 [Prosthecomicrobium hirschii]|uniref:Uncharacterized protein n=1 Tax=Prosthecodimorpha hirschii TaxID=665126 RepID=A0A0P6WG81_9HYPH|nr:hypothetical protein ABB55_27070 [Prosthecomicrobium hirschii]